MSPGRLALRGALLEDGGRGSGGRLGALGRVYAKLKRAREAVAGAILANGRLELGQDRLGHSHAPTPFPSPSPASLRLPDFSPRTIRDLCWRPREPRSWLAAERATSWIPECEVCRKALSFGDGRDPAVSMALDKQEETVRESRYFTAYSDHSRARTLRAKAVVHTTLSCLVHTYTLVPQSLVHSLSDPDPTPFQCSPELQSQRYINFYWLILFIFYL